jgi:hypothetical protein
MTESGLGSMRASAGSKADGSPEAAVDTLASSLAAITRQGDRSAAYGLIPARRPQQNLS